MIVPPEPVTEPKEHPAREAAPPEEDPPSTSTGAQTRTALRAIAGRGVLCCYHRIGTPQIDPFGLCVTPERFAAHLELLIRRAQPATLSEALEPGSGPRFAVTFDDGYADNAEALAIAERYGVPITIFVTSGMLDSSTGFWWDRLAAILAAGRGRGGRDAVVCGRHVRLAVGSRRQEARSLSEIREACLSADEEEIERSLSELVHALGMDEVQVASAPRPFRRAELRELVRRHGNSVDIGGHCVAHVRLSRLSYEEQLSEIRGGKAELEELLEQPVRHFAYPFGDEGSFDENSLKAVADCGLETASTTMPGSIEGSTSVHLLQRRSIMNWGPRRFAAELAYWRL